jgi:DNA-binding NtrC family response regulator
MAATVLVVDDQPSMCLMLAETLSRQGYEVQFAWRSEEARMWIDGGTHFDVVLLDFMMPEMSGDQFADWLHERDPLTNILFITGHARSLLEVHPLQPGEQVLEKPFTRDQLIAAVSRMLPQTSNK